ncbi:MAG: ADP-glyceromanno-heptose 6-epimerase [Chitinophagaceae bacterium]
MNSSSCIAITGAAGFIASYLVGLLNKSGFENLILVDKFDVPSKAGNLVGKAFERKIDREEFIDWAEENPGKIDYIFHLGARTDTTEMDYEVHRKWNLEYSKSVWEICTTQNIPLVYASSAATYGDGELGYSDRLENFQDLRPLNPYGQSKQDFDVWAAGQTYHPPFWAGVKLFNVYGPNEYHKGRMASVILHAFRQIKDHGGMKLFRSHNPNYKDGGQMRDFVYVRDVLNVCLWLMEKQPASGLYNAGSGTARSFLDLAKAIFKAMDKPENISFIDTPLDIRDKYQYFTEAEMQKVRDAGFSKTTYSLEEGVKEYVQGYLEHNRYF